MSEQQVGRKKLEMTRHSVALIEKMKKPYILAKKYDWEEFGRFFSTHKDLLDKQIDLHHSTPLHYAAHSGNPRMYREMIEWVGEGDIKRVLRLQDDMGNTPLHEVAFTGELEMTKSILEHEEEEGPEQQYEPLLRMRNNLGETAVYRAAALGKTDLLSFFLQHLGLDAHRDIHFHRKGDKMSILHTAVIDQFFGTALWILERYEHLAYEKEDNELTTLQLLTKMPSTFKSQTQMGPLKNFIYLLLPKFQDYKYYYNQNKEYTTKKEDLESGRKDKNEPSPTQMKLENNTREGQILKSGGKASRNEPPTTHRKLSAFSWMWYTMWKIMAKEWKEIDKLWRKKEMHNLAKELVNLLAQKDYSWRNTAIAKDRTVSMGRSQQEGKPKEIKWEQEAGEKQEGASKPTYTPLLMAACNGITEIVEVIIRFHPHSIEHASDDEQNILYMAVKHRQKKIYQILKKLKMVRSLAGKIDKESNTVLHYTAEFQGGSQPGFAMQLQEELHWFDRIEKRLPYHYTIHKNQHNKTAKQLFVEKHKGLLNDARKWIKETAQSCSAVAVLVATVVFAAAYTVPGGTDDNGFPRFLHETIFLVFTIMDIVALVSSLGSVIMFLSILTSPCEMWDFRKSLPRKLNTGFALLFFSMATTMLSFSATILINIKLEKNKWTSSLTYAAAFFPVCIFALVQFPLYVAMKGFVRSLRRNLKKIIPRFLLNLLKKSRRKKLWDI